MEKLVDLLKNALKYLKLAVLYLPRLIGVLEKKPEEVEKEQEKK